MRRILRMILAVPVLGFAAADAQTNAPVTLEQLGGAMARAETLLTRFVQERHLSLFSEPLRSEGFLCFQRPGRLRWETISPYKSILVSDGSGVAQFEWADGKWKKLDIGLGAALQNVVSQIVGVMDGRFAADRRGYSSSVTRDSEGYVVRLVPQNATVRRMMAAIEVHMAADLKGTRRVVLRETGGDFTDIRFSEQVANVVMPPRTFDRNAPLDIETIRSAARKTP